MLLTVQGGARVWISVAVSLRPAHRHLTCHLFPISSGGHHLQRPVQGGSPVQRGGRPGSHEEGPRPPAVGAGRPAQCSEEHVRRGQAGPPGTALPHALQTEQACFCFAVMTKTTFEMPYYFTSSVWESLMKVDVLFHAVAVLYTHYFTP